MLDLYRNFPLTSRIDLDTFSSIADCKQSATEDFYEETCGRLAVALKHEQDCLRSVYLGMAPNFQDHLDYSFALVVADDAISAAKLLATANALRPNEKALTLVNVNKFPDERRASVLFYFVYLSLQKRRTVSISVPGAKALVIAELR